MRQRYAWPSKFLQPRALLASVCGVLVVIGAVAVANQVVVSFSQHHEALARITTAHARLAESIKQLSHDRPATQTLSAIAAQARWIEAQLETLPAAGAAEVAPRATGIATSADRLLQLQVGNAPPGTSARHLVNSIRRTEGALEAELAALNDRLDRTHQWRVALIAGPLLLALTGAAAALWLRRNLTGPAQELARLVDPVGGGSPAARRPWSPRRQRYRHALQAARALINAPLAVRHQILDTLPAHVALLDADGTILHVNAGWRQFAAASTVALQQDGVGADYPATCEAAEDPEAKQVGQALRAILAGERARFEFEYPCATPAGERWFRMVACAVPGQEEAFEAAALVMHLEITERKRAEQQLVQMAYYDQLTGLPSRNAFVERLERDIPTITTHDARYVLVLDVQELRAVNDTYGYEAGDEMLITIAGQLQGALASHEHAARLGGDQFAVYLDPRAHGLFDGTVTESVSHWIDELVARPFDESGYRIQIGVWTGMAPVQANDTPADLIRCAALATNMARKQPIARALVYDRELDTRVRERAHTTRALHRAIEHDEFEFDYQPNVRLRDGSIVSAEALIRWDCPDRGRIMPASFIPIAQTSRLIVPIGEWSIRAACQQLRHWQDRGLATGIAVNVSRVHFAHADVAAYVADTLADTGIDPGRLTIEITESAFEQHTDHLLDQLDRLHDQGVQLALDDFGTGYSSLKYLQQCPFDIIKVDMRFTQYVGVDRYSHDVVRMVQVLAGSLGARVVAEGVETAAQRAELLKLGCIFGQGHYFARGMSAHALEGLLRDRIVLPTATDESRQSNSETEGRGHRHG